MRTKGSTDDERERSGGAVDGARSVVAAMALGLALGSMPTAAAEAAGPWRGFVEYGHANNAQTFRVGGSLDWPLRWTPGSLLVVGYTDASLGRWQLDESARDDRAGFTQVGVTPVVRVYGGEPQAWFLEAGIGANLIVPLYRSKNRRFGSTFNFGDHLGIGWRAPGAAGWEATLRIEHFSNGSIKEPNPGKNFTELRIGTAF